MPFEGEFAQYKSVKRLVEDTRVNELLGRYRVKQSGMQDGSAFALRMPVVEPSGWLPKWVIAVDGGFSPRPVDNGFPGAEVGYVTVASVLLDVELLRSLDQPRPIDPRQMRKTEEATSLDWALPGFNVILDDLDSADESFRRSLYDGFAQQRMLTNGESLLDTYHALLARKPSKREQKCPYGDDCGDEERPYTPHPGVYTCPCQHGRPLYSTDALRIHEEMRPTGQNTTLFSEVMQVWERMLVVHVLRSLEALRLLPSLAQFAFVIDGPLAVFGQPAWISEGISDELVRINKDVHRLTGRDIFLVGVEKTGQFVTHFEDLGTKTDCFMGKNVALLDDDYIKRNIVLSDSKKPYGLGTYFGRKFFYKTTSGQRIVGTVPFLDPSHKDMARADVSQFPRLSDAIELMNKLVSARYPNALIPLASANAEAAIPLNLGNRILERLARQLMVEAR